MLDLIFHFLLFIALLFACKEDLKTHSAKKPIQLAILLFCIPLIITDWQELSVIHIFYIIFIFSLGYFGTGGADIKISIPLSLTLPVVPLILFVCTFFTLGMAHGIGIWLRNKKIPLNTWFKNTKVPLIPAIAISYFLVLVWIA